MFGKVENHPENFMNFANIKERVIRSAELALNDQQYVSAIEVFLRMGWLQFVHVQDWKRGKIPFLEMYIEIKPERMAYAMECFSEWACKKGLKPSLVEYLARTSGAKRELQFSENGNPQVELFYKTHFISPHLSEKKQQTLEKKNSQPAELVVFLTVTDSQCNRCKKEMHKNSFLLMEGEEPLCMNCAGLDGLVFLPSGDAGLTRNAKKISKKSAVVVQYSRTRKRYERQGLLVEEEAIAKAQNQPRGTTKEKQQVR